MIKVAINGFGRIGRPTFKGLTLLVFLIIIIFGGFFCLPPVLAENINNSYIASTAWPTLHFDLQRTGKSSFNGPGFVNQLWVYSSSEISILSEVIVGLDGTIYFTTYQGSLYALKPDGTLKWKLQTGVSYLKSTPLVGFDGTIYFGSDKFYAMSPEGSIKWSFTDGNMFNRSSPIIDVNGVIYFTSTNGFLYALNIDGALKWKISIGTISYDSPVLGQDGTVFIRSRNDAQLLAVSPEGSIKWSFPVTDGESQILIGDDGTIYFSSYDHYFYAINPNGSLKYKKYIGVSYSLISIDHSGTLYVGLHDAKQVLAINSDFSTKWVLDAGGPVNCIGAIDVNNTVYIGTDYGVVAALDPNGSIKWQFVAPTGDIISCPILSSNKVIYFGSRESLYAIGEAIINQPPIFSNLNQYKSDGMIVINEGGTTIESTVVFKATVSDPDNDKVKLQVELKEYEQSFDGQNILESDLVDSGNEAVVIQQGLVGGQYKWRARAIDENEAVSGDWQEFGTPGNIDFIIKNLEQAAADLAKELVDSAYLYGGKGWDYNQSEFVAPTTVKTGYSFWNQELGSIAFGAGVDCSGLIMWAYNRSFDPLKSRFDNFVKAEGADEQDSYNTEITTEVQLQPGDVMFFDFDDNDFIDHVVMYVGESGGFDVVNAADPARGIIPDLKNSLKQISGFTAFKRVVLGSQPTILASAHSSVDLVVTDPDGFTITPTTTVNSDLEYLREIPGVLYYSEMEKGIDGNPIDQVYSYTSKTGDYTIQVLPDPGAPPTATYVLDFTAEDQLITLAQDVPVSQIPANGYGIAMSETGIISSFIPVVIDIKPGSDPNTINLKSKGVTPVAVLTDEFFNAENVVIDSVLFAGVSPKKGKLEDVDNDGDLDLILHFETQDLQLTPEDIEATLTGQLTDDSLIKGTDSIKIISPGKSKKQSQDLIGLIPLCIIGSGWLIYRKKPKFPKKIIGRIKRITIKK